MASRTGHVVLLGNSAWTELKQLCIFACRIVKLRAVRVTIFTRKREWPRAKREVLSAVDDSTLVSIVALPDLVKSERDGDDFNYAALVEIYGRLMACQRFKCAMTGEEVGPLPAPRAVISPVFTINLLRDLRQRSQHPVKFLAWFNFVPAVMFLFHAPKDRGGTGELHTKMKQEVATTQRLSQEILKETIRLLSSILVRVPGYEPLYSYEIQPQDLIDPGIIGKQWLPMTEMFVACDGVISTAPACFDGLSYIGNRAWMAESSRGFYAVGPIVPTGPQAVQNELANADKGAETRDFVSRVLRSHGPKSLLYISFGVCNWPKHTDRLWAFLEVVMELRIPFILAHASEFAKIPQEVRSKIDFYQDGLLSSWCPQQMILNHPVTGWFVTQCGHASVMEAIVAGVPMICWPYTPGPALNAIYLSETLKVAYELMQVRTGNGAKRIYRTGVIPECTLSAVRAEARGVLAKAHGEDGAKRRANLAQVQATFAKLWSEGGESWSEAETLLDELKL